MPRLFVAQPLNPEAVVEANSAQAHYLGSVLRRGVGDIVHLFNGDDGEWSARIDTLARGRASFVVTGQTRAQQDDADIWLMFALLKRDTTDLLVQKATKLGVSTLLPVITGRTNAARVNEDRLLAIATEAAEQSERLTVPTIHAPQRLAYALEDWPADRPLYAALERAGAQPIRPAG